MDPNAALAEIRENARRISEAPGDEQSLWAMDLAEYVRALDEWITNGGFTPDEWAGKDGPHVTAKQANTIASFVKQSGVRIVRVDLGSFLSTPTGYLGVVYHYEDGRTLEGGIDRDGAQST